jgi:transposase
MGPNRTMKLPLNFLRSFNDNPPSVVVMDMWKPFLKACRTSLPDAAIVIDKYHVVQKINLALDAVRKSNSDKLNRLKKGRFCLLKRYFRLSDKQFERLDYYHHQSEELAYAYYLKEWFYDLYHQPDYEAAYTFLNNWILEAKRSPFSSYHEVCKTVIVNQKVSHPADQKLSHP